MLKPELQAKFLQHINRKKKGNEGFTLIELLVVIIIIGVLAAIALPSLLNQVNKAKQAEARQNLGTLNRAQQAYYLEANEFASGIGDLAVGIKTETTNYVYEFANGGPGKTSVQHLGKAKGKNLKSHYGAAYLETQTVGQGAEAITETLTLAFLCEKKQPFILGDGTTAENITAQDGKECAADYKQIGDKTKGDGKK